MALNPSTNPTMTGRITAPDTNYPYGSSKDETAAGTGDGTPHFKARSDDIFGFQQVLLNKSGIVPSGVPDNVIFSDYYDAMVALFFNKKIRTISSSDNLLPTDKIVYANSTGGDIVLTSPSASAMVINGASNEILIKRVDVSANKVSITGVEGGTINLTGTGRPFVRIASDGTTIYLVG